MSIQKLSPACKSSVWGGDKLKREFHKVYEGDILAETWELSCHENGMCTIREGEFAGMTLADYIKTRGREVLGTSCARFESFPLLVKFIDAKEDLSIQVHPDNKYALEHEGQYGKTEMWYIVEAEKDAGIYFGVKREVTQEEFARRIKDNTILDVLYFQKVHPGETYLIEAGTIHAIGKGIVIAEVQQNSNLTYRIYDFDRTGLDGKKRELHVNKAKDVSILKPFDELISSGMHLNRYGDFIVDEIIVNGVKHMDCNASSFQSFLIIDGEGGIRSDSELVTFRKGDCLFMDADTGDYTIEGKAKLLFIKVGWEAIP